jgi:hypothetical protein
MLAWLECHLFVAFLITNFLSVSMLGIYSHAVVLSAIDDTVFLYITIILCAAVHFPFQFSPHCMNFSLNYMTINMLQQLPTSVQVHVVFCICFT